MQKTLLISVGIILGTVFVSPVFAQLTDGIFEQEEFSIFQSSEKSLATSTFSSKIEMESVERETKFQKEMLLRLDRIIILLEK